MGRPKRNSPRPSSSVASQRIAFGNAMSRSVAARDAPQHRARGAAGLAAVTGEILPLGRLHARQRRDVHPLLASETERGPRGRTAGIEGGAHGRPGHHLLEVGLPVGELGHRRHEPARGDERLHRRAALDPRLLQTRRQPLGELPLDAGNPARGHLLAADLEQQLPARHAHASSSLAVAGRPAAAAPASAGPAAPLPASACSPGALPGVWLRSHSACAPAIATASLRTRRM